MLLVVSIQEPSGPKRDFHARWCIRKSSAVAKEQSAFGRADKIDPIRSLGLSQWHHGVTLLVADAYCIQELEMRGKALGDE